MHFGIYKRTWFCRWCGKPYKPLKETDRDGFCCPACKQALHRAVKKYNEWKLSRKRLSGNRKSGTRKSRNAKKPKIARPVRVKFYTKKEKLKLSGIGITR